jgi:hypothetical protein
MKLFITNKDDFQKNFDDESKFINSNRDPLTSSQIHKKAFTVLSKSIDVEHSIPLLITTRYDNGDGLAIFNFVTKKDDIFYYEYTGTAS